MGEMGLFGLPFPEEYGGRAATTSPCAWRSRSSARSTRASRSRWRPGVVARRDAGVPLRHRGAEAGVAAAARQRQGARRVRADRGRRRAPTPAPRRPPPGSTTGSGSSTAPSSSSPTPAPTSPGSSPSPRSPARRADGEEGDLVDPRAQRRPPGFTVEPAYDKVGWNTSDTHPLSFDDVRVPRGEPARRARPRLRELPADPRRGPHRDRRAVARRRAGLPRRVA